MARVLGVVLLAAWPWIPGGPAAGVGLSAGDIVAIEASGLFGSQPGPLVHVDPESGARTTLADGAFSDVAVSRDRGIFALGSDAIVEVDASTGATRTIRSVTGLASPTGIAVGDDGSLFVAEQVPAGPGASAGLTRIDPASGEATPLAPLGSFGRVRDLEFSPRGDVVVLADRPGGDVGEERVFLVDALSGASVLTSLGVQSGGALGVSADGGLIGAAAFGFQGTGSPGLDVDSGGLFPLPVPLFVNDAGPCSPGPGCVSQQLRADLAFDDQGRLLSSGSGIEDPTPGLGPRLFRIDVASGAAETVTDGPFAEIQVVRGPSAAVPEPAAALLFGLAFAAVAERCRRL